MFADNRITIDGTRNKSDGKKLSKRKFEKTSIQENYHGNLCMGKYECLLLIRDKDLLRLRVMGWCMFEFVLFLLSCNIETSRHRIATNLTSFRSQHLGYVFRKNDSDPVQTKRNHLKAQTNKDAFGYGELLNTKTKKFEYAYIGKPLCVFLPTNIRTYEMQNS